MRRIFLFLLILLTCLLAGCGKDDTPAPEVSQKPEPSPTAEEASPEIEKTAEPAARAAYAEVLETLLNDGVLPDGTRTESSEDLTQNEFAVLDIDGDGHEELLLSYTTTCVAGMKLYVLSWDEETGETRIQLTEFPNLLAVYDNGVIQAGWSHNQGLGGRFWPYFLYTYDAATDSYIQVGAVDAWDSDIPAEGYPTDIDVSGTGIVYYLYEDMVSQYGEIDPVDESVYQEWLSSYLGDASPIEITYFPLTEENILQMQKP